MTAQGAPTKWNGMTRMLLVKIALAVVLLAAVAAAVTRGYDLFGLVQQILSLVRQAGPTGFFVAMALLPAMGVPQTFFNLAAGPVFAPQLGMPVVLFLSAAAIGTNIAVTYLLARKTLRPLLQKLLARTGYTLPPVSPGNTNDLIVLFRVTPGIPFPVQNYLLGLAGVPFAPYLTISCLIAFPLNAGVILFGEALLNGRGGAALLGVLLLLAALTIIRMVRRKYLRRAVDGPAQAAAPSAAAETEDRQTRQPVDREQQSALRAMNSGEQ
jgi:uncharacterized membrane protein YdjX (TVP38/TMEM64 family)|nr:MAG: hypothetical protein DIU62_09595 [Pseudomonadota bacterium]